MLKINFISPIQPELREDRVDFLLRQNGQLRSVNLTNEKKIRALEQGYLHEKAVFAQRTQQYMLSKAQFQRMAQLYHAQLDKISKRKPSSICHVLNFRLQLEKLAPTVLVNSTGCQAELQDPKIKQLQLNNKKQIQLLNTCISKYASQNQFLASEISNREKQLLAALNENKKLSQLNQKLSLDITQFETEEADRVAEQISSRMKEQEAWNKKLIQEISEIKNKVLQKELEKELLPVRQMKQIDLFQRLTIKLNDKIKKSEILKNKFQSKYLKAKSKINEAQSNEGKYVEMLHASSDKLKKYEKLTVKLNDEFEKIIQDFQQEFDILKEQKSGSESFKSLIKENIHLRHQVAQLKKQLNKKRQNQYRKIRSAFENSIDLSGTSFDEDDTFVNRILDDDEDQIKESNMELKVPEVMPNLIRSLTIKNKNQFSCEKFEKQLSDIILSVHPASEQIHNHESFQDLLQDTIYRVSEKKEIFALSDFDSKTKRSQYKYKSKIRPRCQSENENKLSICLKGRDVGKSRFHGSTFSTNNFL